MLHIVNTPHYGFSNLRRKESERKCVVKHAFLDWRAVFNRKQNIKRFVCQKCEVKKIGFSRKNCLASIVEEGKKIYVWPL